MYSRYFHLFASLFLALALSLGGFTPARAAPPANDNFADAEDISSLPFSATVELSEATTEPDEPQACDSGPRTVWYSITPADTVSIRMTSGANTNVSVYRTSELSPDLQFIQCTGMGGSAAFVVGGAETFYLQLSASEEAGTAHFDLIQVTTIAGNVFDSGGNPLPGNSEPFTTIQLDRVCGEGCLEFVNTTQTDNEGRFIFHGDQFGNLLAAGTYQITVTATGFATEQREATIQEFDSHFVGNIFMQQGTFIGRITGRVLDAQTGMPISQEAAPRVVLHRCEQGFCSFIDFTSVESDGSFSFDRDVFGNRLPPGSYQIEAAADQYQTVQSEIFDVEADMDYSVQDILLPSLPVRFTDVQPCAEIPASGGECVFSVKISNGTDRNLAGKTWSLVDSFLPGSLIDNTNFQIKDAQGLGLKPGQSKVFRFRFSVPANPGSFGTDVCVRIFVGEGAQPLFNTIGERLLFCVFRNASGFEILSPEEIHSPAEEGADVAQNETESEPNNSCQTAQEMGEVSQPLAIAGELTSSLEEPDIDFFRFTATPGSLIGADHEGEATGKGSLADPLLGLFDSDCNLITYNDDFSSLNSHLDITVPGDGAFILAATAFPDSGFAGGGIGSYQLTVAPIASIGSIRGVIMDALDGRPLAGDAPPFAVVILRRCEEFGCFDVSYATPGRDGSFRFETEFSGSALRAGDYLIAAFAEQYQFTETGIFSVGEDQDYDAGTIALHSNPIRFGDVQPCQLPARGGLCEISMTITNGSAARFSGKAWSMVAAYDIGSFINFTNFQADSPREIHLDSGQSLSLKFRFMVPGSVPNGALICATGFAGENPNPFFYPVGRNFSFCFLKGANGFSLLSPQEIHARLQHMPLPEVISDHKPASPKK